MVVLLRGLGRGHFKRWAPGLFLAPAARSGSCNVDIAAFVFDDSLSLSPFIQLHSPLYCQLDLISLTYIEVWPYYPLSPP